MGFWARLFGKGKSAASGSVAPEDGGLKPESETPQGAEAPAAAPETASQDSGLATADAEPSALDPPSAEASAVALILAAENSGLAPLEAEPRVFVQPRAKAFVVAPDVAPENSGETTAEAEPPAPEDRNADAPTAASAVGPEDCGETSAETDPATEPQGVGAPAILLAVGSEVSEATIAQNSPAPEPSLDPEAVRIADGVEYLRTTFGVFPADPNFQATKKVYRSQSGKAAIAFLRTQSVSEPLFYIEVETPDGPFGLDDRNRVFNEHGRYVDF